MTTLHPTPSRGSWFRRIPWWALAAVIALVGVALVGAGLLLTGHGGTTKAAGPTPTCTPNATDSAATPTGTRINVYNATNRNGLARGAATQLGNRGFTIAAVANDPRNATVTGTAVVRHGADSTLQARWAAAQIGGAKLVRITRSGTTVDVVLGNGYSSLASTAAAHQAFLRSAPTQHC